MARWQSGKGLGCLIGASAVVLCAMLAAQTSSTIRGIPSIGTSSDNALVRWDGTGGDRVASSGVTLDDDDRLSIDGGFWNLTGETELTISSGAVTVDRAVHNVDTESDAASDDLVTINGGSEGDNLLLRRNNASRAVVLKHTAGNIVSPTGADVTLPAAGYLSLHYDGSNWVLMDLTPVSAGDVNGPASSTDNAIARFDGAGGTTLQNSGVTINDTGELAMAGQKITGVADPGDDQDAATKAYVDTNSGDASGPGSSTDNALARFDGTSGKLLQDSGVTLDDADRLTLSGGILSFGAETELTIASGVVSVTQSRHSVDTEADAASDDLDTINGGGAGDTVILRRNNASRAVVLKHQTGNIASPTGADVTIPASGYLTLTYDGSDWHISNILPGGTGDVNGPASSTDEAIARFNGSGGKTLQDSGPTINDTGEIAMGGQKITGVADPGDAQDAATKNYVDTNFGDASGPASSTDNALARFDGAGGKTLQDSGVTLDDNDRLALSGGFLNFGAETERTIASGVISITQSLHSVDTESDGASDDLDTINGGTAGDLLLLSRNNASREVVLKHDTGNIHSPSGEDVSIPAAGYVLLVYNGNDWILIDANIGGGGSGDVSGPASSTDHGLARFDGTDGKTVQDSDVTVDDDGRITATLYAGKSATELTISSGAVTITQSVHVIDTESDAASDDLDTISGGTSGDRLFLFRAHPTRAVVLKHNTGNILTPDTNDYTITANGGVMLGYDGTHWRLISAP